MKESIAISDYKRVGKCVRQFLFKVYGYVHKEEFEDLHHTVWEYRNSTKKYSQNVSFSIIDCLRKIDGKKKIHGKESKKHKTRQNIRKPIELNQDIYFSEKDKNRIEARSEIIRDFEKYTKDLTRHERAVLILYLIFGYTFKEISILLGNSKNANYQTQYRNIVKIKKQLKDCKIEFN